MLDDIPRSRIVAGTKQVAKALRRGGVSLVMVADDADDYIRRRFVEICTQESIPMQEYSTMRELGEACQISVGTAVACVLAQELL